MMYSDNENQQRLMASANKPPHWIICRSNTMPNRSYYFDMNSGRAVWNLQDAVDLGINQPGYSHVQMAPQQVSQHLYKQHHHFPEPGNTLQQKDTLRQRVTSMKSAFATNIPGRNFSRQLGQPMQTIVSDYHSPNDEVTATACTDEKIMTVKSKETNEVAKYHKLDPRIKRNNGGDLTLTDPNASEILEVSNCKTFVRDNPNDQTICVTLPDSFLRGTGQSLYRRFAAEQCRTEDDKSKNSVIENSSIDIIPKYGNENCENTLQFNKNEEVNLTHCSKNVKCDPNYAYTSTKIVLDPQYAIYDENKVNDLINVTDNCVYQQNRINVYKGENALTGTKVTNNENLNLYLMDTTLEKNEKRINLKKCNEIKSINTIRNTKNKTVTQLTASPIFILPLSHSENDNFTGRTHTYLYSKSKLTKQVSWIEDIHCNKPCKEALAENITNNNDMFIIKNRRRPNILNTTINDTSAFSEKGRCEGNGNKENIYHKYSTPNDLRKINNPTSPTSSNMTLQHGPKTDETNMEVILLDDLPDIAQSNIHSHDTLKNIAYQPTKHPDLNCLAVDNSWPKIEVFGDYNKHLEHEFARNPDAIRQVGVNSPSMQNNTRHNMPKDVVHELSRNFDLKNESTDDWPTKQANVFYNTFKHLRQDFPDNLDLTKSKSNDWLTKHVNMNCGIPNQIEHELPRDFELKSESNDDWSTKHSNVHDSTNNLDVTRESYDNSFTNHTNIRSKLSKHIHVKSESNNRLPTKQANEIENKSEYVRNQLPETHDITNKTPDNRSMTQINVNNNTLTNTDNQLLKNLNVKDKAIDTWQKPKILEHRVWSGNPLNLRLTPNQSPNFQIENYVNQDSRIIESHYNKPLFKSYFDEEKGIFLNEQIADYEEIKPPDTDDTRCTSYNSKDNQGQLYKEFTQMKNGTEERINDRSTSQPQEGATTLKRKRELSPNDLRLILAAKRKPKTDANVKDTENTSKKFINLRKPLETSKSPKKRVSFSLQDQVHEIERLQPEVPLNVSPSWSLGVTDDYSYTERNSAIFDTETLKTFKVTIRNEKSESYLKGNLSSGDSPMDIDYDITGETNTFNESIAYSESSINEDDNYVLLLDRNGHAENRGNDEYQQECAKNNLNKISFDEYRGRIQSINDNKPTVFKCEFESNKSDITSSIQQEKNTLSYFTNALINDDSNFDPEKHNLHMNSLKYSTTETNKTSDENNTSSADCCKVLDKNIMSEKRRAKSRTEKLMDKITAFEKNPTYPKKVIRPVDVEKTKSILQKLKEAKKRTYQCTNSHSNGCSKVATPSENAPGNESPMKPIKTRIIDKRPFIKTDLNIKRTKREEQRIETENNNIALFEVNSYEKSNLDGYEEETQDLDDAIQNQMMERIDDRIDEYMTHLVQLLEEVTVELLTAKKITTEGLWTLRDQVDCVSKMYELDAGVKSKSRKMSSIMLDLFERNGNFRKITPEKFMMFYTWGLALTDTLQEVYPENKTYSDAIDNLSDLFKRMETSETDKYFYDLEAASEANHEDEKPDLSDSESIYNNPKYVDNYIDNKTPMFGVLSPTQPKRIQYEDFEKESFGSVTMPSEKLVQIQKYNNILELKKLETTNDEQVECVNNNQEFTNDKSQKFTDNKVEINYKQSDMSKIDLRILQNIKISVKATEIQESPTVEKSEFLVDTNNDVSPQNEYFPGNIKCDTKELQNLNEPTNDNTTPREKTFLYNNTNKIHSKIGESLCVTLKNTEANSEKALDVNAPCKYKSDIISDIETQNSSLPADQNIKEYLDLDALDYDYDDSDNDALVVDFDCEDNLSEVASNGENLDKEAPNIDRSETKTVEQPITTTIKQIKSPSRTIKDNNQLPEVAYYDEILSEDSWDNGSGSSNAETVKLSQTYVEPVNESKTKSCPTLKDEHQLFDIAIEDAILSEDLADNNFCSDTKAEKFPPMCVETVNENISMTSLTNNEENQLVVVLVSDSDIESCDNPEYKLETDQGDIVQCDQDVVKYDQEAVVKCDQEDIFKCNQEDIVKCDQNDIVKCDQEDFIKGDQEDVVQCDQPNLEFNINAHPICIEDINYNQTDIPHLKPYKEDCFTLNDSKIKELTPQVQNFTKLNLPDEINKFGFYEERVVVYGQNEDDNEITFKGTHAKNTNNSEFSYANEDLVTVMQALNTAAVNISNFIDDRKSALNDNLEEALDLSLEEVKTLTNDVVVGLKSLLKNEDHPASDVLEPLKCLAPGCVLDGAGDRLGQLFKEHRDSIVPVMKKLIASKKKIGNTSVGTKNVIVLRNGKMIK